MAKVYLDATVVRAILEAGPGPELCGPDGESLGILLPTDVIEAFSRRSSGQAPKGYPAIEAYQKAVADRPSRTRFDPTAPLVAGASTEEVLRMLEAAPCSK